MSRRVMVVDDDDSVLFTVQTILQAAGIDVCTVNSGAECIKALDNGFTGIILLDVMMPEMDGWETLRSMVAKGHADRNIICMLTAKQVPDESMDELKQWVIDYITKPFTHEELVTAVREYQAYTPQ